MPLEPKEEQYCQEYLLDLNQTQAAIRAGYSETSARQIASRLMTKDDILARIAELKAARSKKLKLTGRWVLRRLQSISDRCMQAEPVMVFDPTTRSMVQQRDAEGNALYQFDPHSAIRATELIGKHLGFFEQHNQQKKPGKVTITIGGKRPLPSGMPPSTE